MNTTSVTDLAKRDIKRHTALDPLGTLCTLLYCATEAKLIDGPKTNCGQRMKLLLDCSGDIPFSGIPSAKLVRLDTRELVNTMPLKAFDLLCEAVSLLSFNLDQRNAMIAYSTILDESIEDIINQAKASL